MFHHARILVVEACRELAENLVELLTTSGYHADQVASAAGARRKLKKRSYECVLLDAELPDADSAQLVGELRRQDPELNVVVMAAMLEDAAVRAEHAGASVLRTQAPAGYILELERIKPVRSRASGARWWKSWHAHRRAPSVLR